MKVLITGARAPIACDLARAFLRCGHTVYATDSLRLPVGRFVPGLAGYLRLPAPAHDFKAFEAALATACRAHAIDLVVPTSEEVFWLAQCRTVPAPMLLPDGEVLEQLHHKGRFAELANELGYGVGACRELASPATLQQFARDEDLARWVLKPVYSRFATRVLVGPAAVEVATLPVDPDNAWLAQPRAHGEEVCLYNVAHQGELLLHVAYKPRYRAGAGAGIYFEPVDDARLRTLSAAFARATAFTGQLSFDVMCDGDRLVALECNPRGTSGAHLAAQHPEELVKALLGRPAAPAALQPRRLGLAMLVYHGWRMAPWRYLSLCRQAPDALAQASVPRTTQLGAMAELMWRAAQRGAGALAASTDGIEWNGSAAAHHASRPRD